MHDRPRPVRRRALLAVSVAALVFASCSQGAAPSTAPAVARVLASEAAFAAQPDAPLAALLRMPLTGAQAQAFRAGPLPWEGSYGRYAGPLIESPPPWGAYVGVGVSEVDGRSELQLSVALTDRSAVRALADYAREVGFRGATLELRAEDEPVGLDGRSTGGALRPGAEHFGI